MSITDNLDEDQTTILEILSAFSKEYLYARKELHYESMHSTHEGYAIIKEEIEELNNEIEFLTDENWKKFAKIKFEHITKAFDKIWEEVKLKESNKEKMRAEAIQVGAMALAFILEVCNDD